MDDRVERDAALCAVSSYEEEILRLCGEYEEAMDAFEELGIITIGEKDEANEAEEFTCVITKLREKITLDPGFFVQFCRHIKKIEGLSSIADTLLGEFVPIIKYNFNMHSQSYMIHSHADIECSVASGY
jgi:hypothetical protein